MSAILVIGESGSGKTTSLRNLDPKKVLIIQMLDKELPFKSKFKPLTKENKEGSIVVMNDPRLIVATLGKTFENGKEIVIIDDFQYLMAFEFMARAKELGYTKFTDIAKNAYDVMMAAKNSKSRVYFLTHSEKDSDGFVKTKTIGKMLDEKITVEGLFTIVLKTVVDEDKFYFSTQRNNDVVKTPMGMFDKPLIENDLKIVDDIIVNYYK
jgi:hypothetical protein